MMSERRKSTEKKCEGAKQRRLPNRNSGGRGNTTNKERKKEEETEVFLQVKKTAGIPVLYLNRVIKVKEKKKEFIFETFYSNFHLFFKQIYYYLNSLRIIL